MQMHYFPSRFLGVAFKCNWCSPVVCEFFLISFIYFCYSCISVCFLQHSSLISINGLTHSFSVEFSPFIFNVSLQAFSLSYMAISSCIVCALPCIWLFIYVTKCTFLNWQMRNCVRLRNLLEFWMSVRAFSPSR